MLQNVKRGETIHHMCDRGYIEVTCNMTGTWDMNDIIANDCCFLFFWRSVTRRLCERQRVCDDGNRKLR